MIHPFPIGENPKQDFMIDYSKLTDDEIKTAARKIMRSTSSNDELRQRLKDELGYPYNAGISRCPGMVQMMMWSPRGSVLSV